MHNEYILNKAFQYWSDIGKPEYCAAGAGFWSVNLRIYANIIVIVKLRTSRM